MKKFTLMVLLLLTFTCLFACGKKEFYKDSIFENIESYGSVTKAKQINTNESVKNCSYIYQSPDREMIAKYKAYLLENGFSANSETDSGFSMSKDNASISVSISDSDNTVTVTIPWNKAVTEEKSEGKYTELVDSVKNGQYDGVQDDYAVIKDYKDAANYIAYCNGMRDWDFDNDVGVYSSAIENFTAAGSILDSETKLAEIKKKVSEYNGSYRSIDNLGVIKYIFVKDGKIAQEISSTISTSNLYKYPSPSDYRYVLIRAAFTEEAKKALGGSAASIDQSVKTNMIGSYNGDMNYNEHDYLFMDVSDGKKLAVDISDIKYKTFNGIYEKFSNDSPPEK